MVGFNAQWTVLLAQGNDGIPNPLYTMLPVFLLLFFFLVILPSRRDRQARETMLKGLKKNDRVITTSGIYGIVSNVRPEADRVTIKVDESNNTEITMTLSAIAKVLGDEEKKGA